MTRLHSKSIPGSILAATARVADSFGTAHTDLAGRTISSTARRGSVKNDTFTHNDRSESARQSPRRLVGGLDKRAAFAPKGRAADGAAASHPIRWSSEYNDSELGPVYYNYRHYNPADGRWSGRLRPDWEE